MKKQLLSCGTALCLLLGLLSGCGNTAASSQAPSVSTAEASASVLTASVAEPEESVVETAPMPEDPTELGIWLWEQCSDAQNTLTAADVTSEISVKTSIAGETDSAKSSTRAKYLVTDPDGIQYHVNTTADDIVTELWYDDGVAYLSDDRRKYQAPISAEDFAEAYIQTGESDMMELTAKDFETITGTVTDEGYTLSCSGLNAGARINFDDLLNGRLGDLGGVTDFALQADYTLTKDFLPVDMDLTIDVSVDVLGETLAESIHIITHYNAYNDDVTIYMPIDTHNFRELSDLKILDAVPAAFDSLGVFSAMEYSSARQLTVSDGTTQDDYLNQEQILYRFADIDDFTYHVTNSVSVNGTNTVVYDERYEDGLATIVTTDETGSYTGYGELNGIEFITFLDNLFSYFSDAVYYLTSATMTQEGTNTILTLEVSEEYAAACLDGYLGMFEVDLCFDDATDYTATGSLTLTVDASGTLVKQYFNANAELTTDLGTFTLTCQEGGDVVATGDAVNVNSGY